MPNGSRKKSPITSIYDICPAVKCIAVLSAESGGNMPSLAKHGTAPIRAATLSLPEAVSRANPIPPMPLKSQVERRQARV